MKKTILFIGLALITMSNAFSQATQTNCLCPDALPKTPQIVNYINTCEDKCKENNQPPVDASSPNPTGWAGVQFADLTAECQPQANPGPGVLSVDKCGDIIYVPAAPGGGTGGITCADNGTMVEAGCVVLGGTFGNSSSTLANLLSNRTIPMVTYDLEFTKNYTENFSVGYANGILSTATPFKGCNIMGGHNTITGNDHTIFGYENGVYSDGGSAGQGFVFGSANLIGLNSSSYCNNAHIVGSLDTIDEHAVQSMIVGYGSHINGPSQLSYAIGSYDQTFGSSNCMALGFGVPSTAHHVIIGSTTNSGNSAYHLVDAGWSALALAGLGYPSTDFPAIDINENAVGIRTLANTYISLLVQGIAVNTTATRGGEVDAGPTSGSLAAYINDGGVSGNVGLIIDAISGNHALDCNGDAYAPVSYWLSDQKFKNNLNPVSNAINTIKQLKPMSYFFNTQNQYGMNFTDKKQYGFVAQEIEKILPELVSSSHKPEGKDAKGNVISQEVDYKAINYIGFIAILTEGIQEQQKTIEELKQKVTSQDSMINFIAQKVNAFIAPITPQNNSTANVASIDVKLTDAQTVILDQNSPNPFAEETTINYFLPDNTGKAEMLFYNAGGKLIQSVELLQKGQGHLNVYAQDLSNGIYSYTLVVDGKIFDTKKMVKQ